MGCGSGRRATLHAPRFSFFHAEPSPNEVCWRLTNDTESTQGPRKEKKKKRLSLSLKATGTDWASHGKTAVPAHFLRSAAQRDPGEPRATAGLAFLEAGVIGTILCPPSCLPASAPGVRWKEVFNLDSPGKNRTSTHCFSGTASGSQARRSSVAAVPVKAEPTGISSRATE